MAYYSDHSSVCSARASTTSHRMSAPFKTIATALERRLISPLIQFSELVECSQLRRCRNEFMQAAHRTGLIHADSQSLRLRPQMANQLPPLGEGRDCSVLLDGGVQERRNDRLPDWPVSADA